MPLPPSSLPNTAPASAYCCEVLGSPLPFTKPSLALAFCYLISLCLYSRRSDSSSSEEGGSTVGCRDSLEDYLRENRIPFETQHHPRVVTAQEVAASEHVPGKMLAKTVMVLADREMVMLALPAPTRSTLRRLPRR